MENEILSLDDPLYNVYDQLFSDLLMKRSQTFYWIMPKKVQEWFIGIFDKAFPKIKVSTW